jgi:hypothetical protein
MIVLFHIAIVVFLIVSWRRQRGETVTSHP